MSSRLLDFGYRLWHKTAVPIFIERFVLPLFAAGVIVLAATNPMGFDKTQRVLGSVILILSAYWLAHTIYRPPQKEVAEKLFSASVLSIQQNDPRMPFWVVSKPAKTAFPVDLFLKIRIVNLQKTTALLDSIGIEIKGTNDWIRFKPIPLLGMNVEVGHLAAVRECTVSPPDIAEVFKKEMNSGATATATGFFESSVLPVTLPTPQTFRITLRDSVGRVTVIEAQEATVSEEPTLDMTSFTTFGPLQDFSEFRQQRL